MHIVQILTLLGIGFGEGVIVTSWFRDRQDLRAIIGSSLKKKG